MVIASQVKKGPSFLMNGQVFSWTVKFFAEQGLRKTLTSLAVLELLNLTGDSVTTPLWTYGALTRVDLNPAHEFNMQPKPPQGTGEGSSAVFCKFA